VLPRPAEDWEELQRGCETKSIEQVMSACAVNDDMNAIKE